MIIFIDHFNGPVRAITVYMLRLKNKRKMHFRMSMEYLKVVFQQSLNVAARALIS